MVTVGERALALLYDEPGVIEQYTAQWGGADAVLTAVLSESANETASETIDKNANESDSADTSLRALVGSGSEMNWRYRQTVTGTTTQDAVDYLAFEIVYTVSPAGVSVYQAVWHGLSPACPPGDGTLVRIDSLAEHHLFRRVLRQYKALLHEFVAVDLLTEDRAALLVATFLRTGFPERAITARENTAV